VRRILSLDEYQIASHANANASSFPNYVPVCDAVYNRPKFPCRKDHSDNLILDRLFDGGPFLTGQQSHGTNVNRALDRQVNGLIHKNLFQSRHESIFGWQDGIAEFVVLMDERAKAQTDKSVSQRPTDIKVENVFALKGGLTQPVSQQVDNDVDQGLGNDGFVGQIRFVGAPIIEGDPHDLFLDGPSSGHATVNVKDGVNGVSKGGRQKDEINNLLLQRQIVIFSHQTLQDGVIFE
jgi:hypothetical protein